ncbi:hypothetical protein LSAT2_026219 [Lamellibrachia satsuma]|nr:hypothetical protein LSAT2_026219 [Lamellibrachia satsuma]
MYVWAQSELVAIATDCFSSVRCLCGGFALQAAVKVVSSISSILRRPRALRHALLHQHNLQLGAFLASFTALFQGMSCLLRHLLGQENATHGLLAGLLAGTSMFLYKSSTVALYMTSKLTEILYMKGIEAGLLPYVQSADILLYAVSMSLIIHVAILEPHNLRPTYWKFLLKLTHGQLGEINRKLLDIYGTGASKLYPDFKPH